MKNLLFPIQVIVFLISFQLLSFGSYATHENMEVSKRGSDVYVGSSILEVQDPRYPNVELSSTAKLMSSIHKL
ncbi:MAG: hypothetical protein KAH25_10585, partial [Bacteroidales bacterium]|nr:hypothetical protein [Bacteroidales bacterium]